MNKDNALREALNRRKDDLPYGFDTKLMERIVQEAERKSLLSYYRSLALVAVVSVVMLGSALFALYHYFSFNIFTFFARLPEQLSGNGIPHENGPSITFYSYIALLMLLLLGLDHLFRRRMRKENR